MAKVKIIKELPPKFKEIKKDEEEEENLEEEVSEMPEEETFSEFIEGERTAPVLETITIPDTESLEQELENVPSIPRTDTSRRTDYVTNTPDYSGNEQIKYEEEQERKGFEIKDISEISRQRELNRVDIRQREQDFSQLSSEERAEREIKEYQELRKIKEQEERRLPFDRKERRRESILK